MFGWLRSLNKRMSAQEATPVETAPVEQRRTIMPPLPELLPLAPAAPATSSLVEDAAPTSIAPAEPQPAPVAVPAVEIANTEAGLTEHGPTEPAPSYFAADLPTTTEVEAPTEAITPVVAEHAADEVTAPEGAIVAPSLRPAMPLSATPNFAGLSLAEWEPTEPRLLQPEAALSPEAQLELLRLFDELFGPTGRYRLEWRTNRELGDDAMFAEIMTADLVRRVQNTIADVEALDRPTPLPAIEARRHQAPVERAPKGALEPKGLRQAS